jgi:predicted secreted protein
VGKSMQVVVGEVFDIPLEGNLTTGYRWEVLIPSTANAMVELLDESWEPEAKHPGSSTIQHFRFRALSAGQVDLLFHYKRPWEKLREREKKIISLHITSGYS